MFFYSSWRGINPAGYELKREGAGQALGLSRSGGYPSLGRKVWQMVSWEELTRWLLERISTLSARQL